MFHGMFLTIDFQNNQKIETSHLLEVIEDKQRHRQTDEGQDRANEQNVPNCCHNTLVNLYRKKDRRKSFNGVHRNPQKLAHSIKSNCLVDSKHGKQILRTSSRIKYFNNESHRRRSSMQSSNFRVLENRGFPVLASPWPRQGKIL